MKLVLPVPPSANRYWRVRAWRGRAKTYKSPEARAYQQRVMVLAHPWPKPPPTGPVVVTLRWFQGRRSGDLDDRIKVVLDALQGIAYQNDRQIIELHAFRDYDSQHPRLEITIERRDT